MQTGLVFSLNIGRGFFEEKLYHKTLLNHNQLGVLFVSFINMAKRFSRSKFLKLRHAMNINLSFKNPDNCRWAVLNRKNRLTHFLDTLRGTLVELSQK